LGEEGKRQGRFLTELTELTEFFSEGDEGNGSHRGLKRFAAEDGQGKRRFSDFGLFGFSAVALWPSVRNFGIKVGQDGSLTLQN